MSENRRQNFRVDVAVKAWVTIDKSTREGAEGAVDMQAHTIDLSGSGARLKTTAPVGADDELVLRLALSDKGIPATLLNLRARVIRAIRRGAAREAAVQFIDVPLADEEKIVKFVFFVQRRDKRPT